MCCQTLFANIYLAKLSWSCDFSQVKYLTQMLSCFPSAVCLLHFFLFKCFKVWCIFFSGKNIVLEGSVLNLCTLWSWVPTFKKITYFEKLLAHNLNRNYFFKEKFDLSFFFLETRQGMSRPMLSLKYQDIQFPF